MFPHDHGAYFCGMLWNKHYGPLSFLIFGSLFHNLKKKNNLFISYLDTGEEESKSSEDTFSLESDPRHFRSECTVFIHFTGSSECSSLILSFNSSCHKSHVQFFLISSSCCYCYPWSYPRFDEQESCENTKLCNAYFG